MITLHEKKILVIAPHPDDEVIGCGGLISRIKTENGKVYVLFLTFGTTTDFSKQGKVTAAQRQREIKKVAQYLHFDNWRVAFPGNAFHLRLDNIPQKELIHEIELGRSISLEATRPDIILFPLFGDYNQDHRAAAEAVFTACRPALTAEKFVPDIILSYEFPMSSWAHPIASPSPNFHVQIRQQDINAKIYAMNIYKSQTRPQGHPRSSASMHALATLRGSMIGQPFAESFYCHRIRVS